MGTLLQRLVRAPLLDARGADAIVDEPYWRAPAERKEDIPACEPAGFSAGYLLAAFIAGASLAGAVTACCCATLGAGWWAGRQR